MARTMTIAERLRNTRNIAVTIAGHTWYLSPQYDASSGTWSCLVWEHGNRGWDDPVSSYDDSREDTLAHGCEYLMRYLLSEDGDIS